MEAVDQQNYNQRTSVQNPQPYIDANVVMLQLDTSEIMNDVEHYLRCEYFDQKTKSWTQKPNTKPLLNETGINNLMAVVRSHLDKNHALTYYTEDQIFRIIMQPLAIDLIWNVRNNWEYYDMNKNNADIILDVVINATFASVMRSREGATLDVFKNTQKVSTTFDSQKRTGIAGFLGGLVSK